MGKVNAALNILSKDSSAGIIAIDDATIRTLQQKHPQASPKYNDLLLQGPQLKVNPVTFDNIDEQSVQRAALRSKGAAGPFQMDAENWRRILVSKLFGNKSIDLAKAVAKMCKIMCSETCNYENNRDMEAFVACTLDT